MYSALSTLNTTTEVSLSKAPNPQLLSPPSIPRLRCPWARHRIPNCSLHLQYHDWGALEQGTEPPTALSTFNTTTEVSLSKAPNPQLLSPPSIPRLRCPWARHRTPNCSLHLQYHDWGVLEQGTEPPTALSTLNTTTEVPLSKAPNPQLLSPPSIPRLRCPWARHRTPNCSLHLQYHDWGVLEQGTEPPTALSTLNTTTEVPLSKAPNPQLLSPPSIPRLRCPWARHRTPNCSLHLQYHDWGALEQGTEPPTALSTFNTTTEVPLSKAPNPQLLSPPSIPRLRCPWARHRTPNCSQRWLVTSYIYLSKFFGWLILLEYI